MRLNKAFHSCAALPSPRSMPTPLMRLREEVPDQEVSQVFRSNEFSPKQQSSDKLRKWRCWTKKTTPQDKDK